MKPIDEVKLTAYALGELSAAERQEIEVQLKEQPAQQTAVNEIRALAARLATDLQNEPEISLSDAQRQAILEAPAQGALKRGYLFLRKWGGLAAVAAVVAVVFGGAFWSASRTLHHQVLVSSLEQGEVTMNNPNDHTESESLTLECMVQELPEMAELIAPSQIDDLPPPPDIQDFAAAPMMDSVAELNIASDPISPIIMKSLAPGQMANRSGAARCSSVSPCVGSWMPPPRDTTANTESYASLPGNAFKSIAAEPLSTFSIDVDTASYANLRRFLQAGQMPPPDAVRVEEMINYFSYDYAQPKEDVPFAVHVESATCPWNKAHQLVKIGLQGRELDAASRAPCNLVFLIDVSGSMSDENKLPLVKKALQLMAKQLAPQDRVSIVVYASASGLVLPSTACDNLQAIHSALENLQAGGSTAGGEGIRLAYDEALKNFQPEGNNRVILCTDGDFNVGIIDSEELAAFIAERAKKGIFLTILGFGMGNYKDDRLETLADKGNGNYAYIDSFSEARKNLAEQAAGTLFTIAKDVKLQIEFNPAHFSSYRLIGYENRVLAKEDFNNDKKDAGELGAGHTVTAFYELVPTGVESTPGVDPLKYQPSSDEPKLEAAKPKKSAQVSPEWFTVKLRYKLPNQNQSTKIEIPYVGTFAPFENASDDFRFAAGVAAGGLMLHGDSMVLDLDYRSVIDWTSTATGQDSNGYRREFIQLLQDAAVLAQ